MRLNGEVATVGISRFAVDQLTDLIMIDLPAVGTKLIAGKSFGEVESVKAVSDLYAPVGGEVVEVNGEVTGNVQLLAEDPYEKGWLVKVRVETLRRPPSSWTTTPTRRRWLKRAIEWPSRDVRATRHG